MIKLTDIQKRLFTALLTSIFREIENNTFSIPYTFEKLETIVYRLNELLPDTQITLKWSDKK